MNKALFTDRLSYIVALVSALVAFALFFLNSGVLTYSLFAGALFFAIVWLSYVVLHLIYLAIIK